MGVVLCAFAPLRENLNAIIVVLDWRRCGREFHDGFADFDGLDGAVLAIDDLAAWGDEDGVGDGAGPVFVDDVGQGVAVDDRGDVVGC
jgi:hypothetical protein